MASSFPGRELPGSLGYGVGSAVQLPYQQRSDGGTAAGAAGLLKRSLTELERQHQIQSAIFLRSVKQRNHLYNPISPLYHVDLSTLSSSAVPLRGLDSSVWPSTSAASASQADSENKSTMTNRLLELERQLLDDDDDESSVSGSAVTNSEWCKTMQTLASQPPQRPPPSPPATNQSPISPSPTTSSSSSSSSRASSSPSASASSRLMLQDTAAAISEGNLDAAAANLAVLKRAANPRGDPEQRLAAMMVAALVYRINPRALESSVMIADVCSAEHQTAAHMLYEASPCFKLALMAANLAILEATKDTPKIHILDFDVGQGRQLASLIHAIAERHRQLSPSCPPPMIKITSVCEPSFPFNSSAGDRKLVGDRLGTLADRLGLALRFRAVSLRTTELSQEALGCEIGEALAVNFAFLLSRVADESVSPANPRDELLRRVKTLRPSVVALAEQEMNGNTAPFTARFKEACANYGALLESLEATAGRESSDRARVEGCLARKAANSVATEGSDRVERCEVYGKWRARFGMAGFHPVPIGTAAVEPVKARFATIGNNPGFTIKEEAGWVGCGWMGRVLTVTSTWR